MKEIILSRLAEFDLKLIWAHVAEDNLYAADALLLKFADLFNLLGEMPHMGRSRAELSKSFEV